MNDRPTNLNAALEPNCEIIIEPSTAGKPATCTLDQLEEYTTDSVAFVVNGNIIRCPKFLEVNGNLELPSYQIKEGDQVETRSFYTVGQLAEFMDVEVNVEHVILVNNRRATLDSLIYENFTIEWTVRSYGKPSFQPVEQEEVQTPTVGEYKEEEVPDIVDTEMSAEADGAEVQNPEVHNAVTAEDTDDAGNAGAKEKDSAVTDDAATVEESKTITDSTAGVNGSVAGENAAGMDETDVTEENADGMAEAVKKVTVEENSSPAAEEDGSMVLVYINGQPVKLTGKPQYIFVDIFDFYEFDLTASNGRAIITNLNGENASYSAVLKTGDTIELRWKEN